MHLRSELELRGESMLFNVRFPRLGGNLGAYKYSAIYSKMGTQVCCPWASPDVHRKALFIAGAGHAIAAVLRISER